jgi:CRISPR-associated protein Cmx8
MIRGYVGQKVKKRTGKASDYKNQDSRDAINRVCMDAFYQIRSRKDHRDFVNYWTSTICSVPQFIHSEEFTDVADTLLDEERWEDVQSLALLALSAESQQEPKVAGDQTKKD